MKNKKLSAFLILFLLFLMSLFPITYRTYQVSSNTTGLILLAIQNNNSVSNNPYANESYFITPNMAMWLIKNTHYHFGNCTANLLYLCELSVVNLVGNLMDTGTNINKEEALLLVEFFIKIGNTVNDYSPSGYTPLHDAIEMNNVRYVNLLLENGADLSLPIKNNQHRANGATAIQYLEYLERNHPNKMIDIRKLINVYSR